MLPCSLLLMCDLAKITCSIIPFKTSLSHSQRRNKIQRWCKRSAHGKSPSLKPPGCFSKGNEHLSDSANCSRAKVAGWEQLRAVRDAARGSASSRKGVAGMTWD